MTDILTPARRSWNMARIRSRNTAPELMVRAVLHRQGYRFRLNVRELPGSPDLVLPRYRVAVFVHGCFWHRHESCRLAYTPKSNIAFWRTKFERNVKRDARTRAALQRSGWTVVVYWQCETGTNPDAATAADILRRMEAAVLKTDRRVRRDRLTKHTN